MLSPISLRLPPKHSDGRNGSKFYSILETAHRLGVHSDTVRRRVRDHTLPAVVIAHRWMIPEEAIKAFKKARPAELLSAHGADLTRRFDERHPNVSPTD